MLSSALIIFYSCSASTDTRYETDKDKSENKKDPATEISEDFDISPYRTKLKIPEKDFNLPSSGSISEIWYGYEDTIQDTSAGISRKIIDKVPGYRVLLLTTDNLEEANLMKEEVYSKNTQRQVYVIFDPPFYKVMVGDFTEYSEASDLSFKMNQLGYTEARVVNETVNIFE